jgi:hypothetical protein
MPRECPPAFRSERAAADALSAFAVKCVAARLSIGIVRLGNPQYTVLATISNRALWMLDDHAVFFCSWRSS